MRVIHSTVIDKWFTDYPNCLSKFLNTVQSFFYLYIYTVHLLVFQMNTLHLLLHLIYGWVSKLWYHRQNASIVESWKSLLSLYTVKQQYAIFLVVRHLTQNKYMVGILYIPAVLHLVSSSPKIHIIIWTDFMPQWVMPLEVFFPNRNSPVTCRLGIISISRTLNEWNS